jgi:hypothetical protein
VWKNIEYINGSWYRIYWNTFDGKYSVASEDRIESPHLFSLGTAILPYETREEKPKESPKEESPKEHKTVSDLDEPIPTVEASRMVEYLAGQFHQTDLEPSPFEDATRTFGLERTHQIYLEMAMAATTITAPQQITTQAAPPLPQQPQQQLGCSTGFHGVFFPRSFMAPGKCDM